VTQSPLDRDKQQEQLFDLTNLERVEKIVLYQTYKSSVLIPITFSNNVNQNTRSIPSISVLCPQQVIKLDDVVQDKIPGTTLAWNVKSLKIECDTLAISITTKAEDLLFQDQGDWLFQTPKLKKVLKVYDSRS
jgi:predicted nucleic acid-binding protein